jgi:hypothetical protein
MSRKRRARRNRPASVIHTRRRGPFPGGKRAVTILALLLGASVLVTAGMLASSQRARNARKAAGTLAPQTSGTPSKEYVYAGGRLIATEEPASSSAPPVPTNVIAKPSGSATSILVSWSPSSGATSYTVLRKTSLIDTGTQIPASASPITDTVTQGATYLYYVSASGGGGTSAYSTLTSTSFATAFSFVFGAPTAPLTPNSVISAAHVNTIRNAIDAVRRAAGLSNFSYGYSISTGSTIKANDIVDGASQSMRTAITQAYSALGFSAPSFTNSISQGSTVKFADYSDFSGYASSDGLVRGLHP